MMSKIWKYILEKRFNYLDGIMIGVISIIIRELVK
jgi:hypothetical protein